jgi:hypothetical protein
MVILLLHKRLGIPNHSRRAFREGRVVSPPPPQMDLETNKVTTFSVMEMEQCIKKNEDKTVNMR